MKTNVRLRLVALGLVLVSSASLKGADPTDAFGDPLPKGAKVRPGTESLGHPTTGHMLLPPNYTTFIGSDNQGTIGRFDAVTGRLSVIGK